MQRSESWLPEGKGCGGEGEGKMRKGINWMVTSGNWTFGGEREVGVQKLKCNGAHMQLIWYYKQCYCNERERILKREVEVKEGKRQEVQVSSYKTVS